MISYIQIFHPNTMTAKDAVSLINARCEAKIKSEVTTISVSPLIDLSMFVINTGYKTEYRSYLCGFTYDDLQWFNGGNHHLQKSAAIKELSDIGLFPANSAVIHGQGDISMASVGVKMYPTIRDMYNWVTMCRDYTEGDIDFNTPCWTIILRDVSMAPLSGHGLPAAEAHAPMIYRFDHLINGRRDRVRIKYRDPADLMPIYDALGISENDIVKKTSSTVLLTIKDNIHRDIAYMAVMGKYHA